MASAPSWTLHVISVSGVSGIDNVLGVLNPHISYNGLIYDTRPSASDSSQHQASDQFLRPEGTVTRAFLFFINASGIQSCTAVKVLYPWLLRSSSRRMWEVALPKVLNYIM